MPNYGWKLLLKQITIYFYVLIALLQSRFKCFLIDMYGHGYLSKRLTKTCFRLFRLRGA